MVFFFLFFGVCVWPVPFLARSETLGGPADKVTDNEDGIEIQTPYGVTADIVSHWQHDGRCFLPKQLVPNEIRNKRNEQASTSLNNYLMNVIGIVNVERVFTRLTASVRKRHKNIPRLFKIGTWRVGLFISLPGTPQPTRVIASPLSIPKPERLRWISVVFVYRKCLDNNKIYI